MSLPGGFAGPARSGEAAIFFVLEEFGSLGVEGFSGAEGLLAGGEDPYNRRYIIPIKYVHSPSHSLSSTTGFMVRGFRAYGLVLWPLGIQDLGQDLGG